MYAVGVAGNMLYSAAGSGTMDEYMAKGLIENLNYDKICYVCIVTII